MRIVRRRNQIFGIEKEFGSILNVLKENGIHMMNIDSSMDLIALDSKIATAISYNYLIAKLLPFSRTIELLIEISVKTKSF